MLKAKECGFQTPIDTMSDGHCYFEGTERCALTKQPGEKYFKAHIEYIGCIEANQKDDIRRAVEMFFPEIRYIRFARAWHKKGDDFSGVYIENLRIIGLKKYAGLHTIGHEIAHFMQDKQNHDEGWIEDCDDMVFQKTLSEKGADVYCMARGPDLVTNFWYNFDCHTYLDLPEDILSYLPEWWTRKIISDICRGAWRIHKEEGYRNYISLAEDWIWSFAYYAMDLIAHHIWDYQEGAYGEIEPY